MTDVTAAPPDRPDLPLGRLIEHDPRSLRYPFKAEPARALLSVRHRSHIGILDQSRYFQSDGTGPISLGSCVGNATISALAHDPFWDTIKDLPIVTDGWDQRDAVEVIYGPASQNDPWPGGWPPDDTGTSGLAGAKVAKQAGLISGYRHGLNIIDDLAALQDYPVITGIDWMSSFDSPDAEGIIKITPTARSRGGHELCVDEYDATRGLVFGPQSWGTGWGNKGRYGMAVETWSTLLDAQGDVTVFVPLTAPAPQPLPMPGTDARFPGGASVEVADRVARVAARSSLTREAWLERHLRGYFGLPR